MVTQSKLLFLFLILAITLVSCKKDPEVISGCTDPLGDTYNPDASIDNSSCTYQKRFLGDYNVIPGGGDTQVLCDGKVKTILAISADNKILTGSLKIDLITKEPALINGIFSIPAGYTLSDECDFKGTKI
ncbi:MAG: hypothetical protein IPL55_04610 [Saprospiraceae bacterium]|nr:hypothetical protein [Saprospiraceae bacterium]